MIHSKKTDETLLPMGRLHALALTLFGPPDTASHPFTGTRYDPRLRQRQDAARRAERTRRHHFVVRPTAS